MPPLDDPAGCIGPFDIEKPASRGRPVETVGDRNRSAALDRLRQRQRVGLDRARRGKPEQQNAAGEPP